MDIESYKLNKTYYENPMNRAVNFLLGLLTWLDMLKIHEIWPFQARCDCKYIHRIQNSHSKNKYWNLRLMIKCDYIRFYALLSRQDREKLISAYNRWVKFDKKYVIDLTKKKGFHDYMHFLIWIDLKMRVTNGEYLDKLYPLMDNSVLSHLKNKYIKEVKENTTEWFLSLDDHNKILLYSFYLRQKYEPTVWERKFPPEIVGYIVAMIKPCHRHKLKSVCQDWYLYFTISSHIFYSK